MHLRFRGILHGILCRNCFCGGRQVKHVTLGCCRSMWGTFLTLGQEWLGLHFCSQSWAGKNSFNARMSYRGCQRINLGDFYTFKGNIPFGGMHTSAPREEGGQPVKHVFCLAFPCLAATGRGSVYRVVLRISARMLLRRASYIKGLGQRCPGF